MKPFEPATLRLPKKSEFIKQWATTLRDYYPDKSRDELKKYAADAYDETSADEVFMNDVYQVNVRRNRKHGFSDDYGLTHLSIKRIDKQPIHDWRHLQEIKNFFCGVESEGVELYPAESRLADSANQYHLWVFPEGMKLPFGFFDRFVCGDSNHGAIQRPFDDKDKVT